jgi:hypothetical protein
MENTFKALQEVKQNLINDNELSKSEQSYKDRLIELCIDIADYHRDYFDDYDDEAA